MDWMNTLRRNFIRSILVLIAMFTLAISGLSIDGNWIKALRVSIAVVVYCGILLLMIRQDEPDSIPVWPFLIAAASAEMTSGWLRPDARSFFNFPVALAAMLLGLIHWIALRCTPAIYNRIRSGR